MPYHFCPASLWYWLMLMRCGVKSAWAVLNFIPCGRSILTNSKSVELYITAIFDGIVAFGIYIGHLSGSFYIHLHDTLYAHAVERIKFGHLVEVDGSL